MKIKKQYLYISLALILIIFTGFLYLNFHSSQPPLSWEEVQVVPKALSVKNTKVFFVILNKKYETEVKEGETVYGAMKSIESVKENNFSFVAKEYSSLGVFVEEINGIKGENGKYWIYYVNDKEASVGVSNYKINNGDIISWKYEK